MIDMASTTVPYDENLVKGLLESSKLQIYLAIHSNSKININLDNFKIIKVYKLSSLFANVTNNLYILRLVKLLEHPYVLISLMLYAFKLKPNVIHVQWTQFPLIDSLLYKVLKNYFPLVFTAHNTTIGHGEKNLVAQIQSIGINRFINLFSKVIVHTNKSKETFINHFNFNPSNVEVIAMGCQPVEKSTEKIKANFLKKNKINAAKETIVFFGNINQYKGLDTLLKAIARLSSHQKNKVRLLVLGKPREPMEHYFNISKIHNLESLITWDLRFIPENMLDAIYSSATIFVLPYRHIDQSAVLMSILKYGKPIIASDADGFSEILTHDHNALIFPIDDDIELSKMLIELIEDQKKKYRIGSSVYSLYKKWPSKKAIGELHEKIYTELLSHND
jgi:glycosyltransferase involved in cell wall biosynthesis